MKDDKNPLAMPFDDECINEVFTDAEHRANIDKYNKYHLLDMIAEYEIEVRELNDKIDKARQHLMFTVPNGYQMSTVYKILTK